LSEGFRTNCPPAGTYTLSDPPTGNLLTDCPTVPLRLAPGIAPIAGTFALTAPPAGTFTLSGSHGESQSLLPA